MANLILANTLPYLKLSVMSQFTCSPMIAQLLVVTCMHTAHMYYNNNRLVCCEFSTQERIITFHLDLVFGQYFAGTYRFIICQLQPGLVLHSSFAQVNSWKGDTKMCFIENSKAYKIPRKCFNSYDKNNNYFRSRASLI